MYDGFCEPACFSPLPVRSCVRFREQVDLIDASFEEFIEFLFDREFPPTADFEPLPSGRRRAYHLQPWYRRTDVTVDLLKICAYYTRLFRAPEFLRERFSREQLELGFLAIQGTSFFGISRIVRPDSPHLVKLQVMIRNQGLPFEMRAECVRAMHDLYEKLFFNEPLEHSVYMWWHMICIFWDPEEKSPSHGGEDEAMQDVIFETLSRILLLDSAICQGAAIHGLSHLHHPQTVDLISQYLDRHPDMEEERWRIALAASRFDLM